MSAALVVDALPLGHGGVSGILESCIVFEDPTESRSTWYSRTLTLLFILSAVCILSFVNVFMLQTQTTLNSFGIHAAQRSRREEGVGRGEWGQA